MKQAKVWTSGLVVSHPPPPKKMFRPTKKLDLLQKNADDKRKSLNQIKKNFKLPSPKKFKPPAPPPLWQKHNIEP